MTPTELRNLAQKINLAHAPDRAFDWAIAEHLGEIPKYKIAESMGYDWTRKPGEYSLYMATNSEGSRFDSWRPRGRTFSTDEAIAFLPDGWTMAHISHDDKKRWHCELRRGFQTSYSEVMFGGTYPFDHGAETPPLAIVPACLKALAFELELPSGKADWVKP